MKNTLVLASKEFSSNISTIKVPNLFMSRRKNQRKQKFTEEEDLDVGGSDLDNWRVTLPDFIGRLADADDDERPILIHKINDILTARPVGAFIKPYLDEVVDNLHRSIFEYTTIEEHNEALLAMCAICANTYGSFEPCGITFLNEIIPTLDRCTDEESLRFFTIGYVCILSIRNPEFTTPAINKLFSFFKSEKVYNKLSVDTVTNIIQAISMMLCCFSVSTVADVFMESIEQVLDNAFESADGPILLAALDLFSLASEYLIERQYVDDKGEEYVEPKPEAEEIYNEFVEKYKKPIRSAPSGVDKKTDQKLVREKSKAVLANIDGDTLTAKITVNIQTGEICGAKKLIFLQATKRVARFHFEQMMTINKGLQSMFGLAFLDRSKAELLKLKLRDEIDFSREAAEKERSLAIAKQRKQKEKRGHEDF